MITPRPAGTWIPSVVVGVVWIVSSVLKQYNCKMSTKVKCDRTLTEGDALG